MTPPRIDTPAQLAVLEERDKHFDRRLESVEAQLGDIRDDVKDINKSLQEQSKELTRIAVNLDSALARRQAEDKPEPWFTGNQKKVVAAALVAILTALAAILGSFSSSATSEARPTEPTVEATE